MYAYAIVTPLMIPNTYHTTVDVKSQYFAVYVAGGLGKPMGLGLQINCTITSHKEAKLGWGFSRFVILTKTLHNISLY